MDNFSTGWCSQDGSGSIASSRFLASAGEVANLFRLREAARRSVAVERRPAYRVDIEGARMVIGADGFRAIGRDGLPCTVAVVGRRSQNDSGGKLLDQSVSLRRRRLQ